MLVLHGAQQDDGLHQGFCRFITLLVVSEPILCGFEKTTYLKSFVTLLQIYPIFIIVMASCRNKLVEAGPVGLVSDLTFDPKP